MDRNIIKFSLPETDFEIEYDENLKQLIKCYSKTNKQDYKDLFEDYLFDYYNYSIDELSISKLKEVLNDFIKFLIL